MGWLYNEEAPPPVAGIPHPGVFALDREGIVTQKRFYESYRERDGATTLLFEMLGLAPGAAPSADPSPSGEVAVRAWFDAPEYAWGQRLTLTVELAIPPGLHVYGQPTPDGYQALTVTLETGERVLAEDPHFPPATPFRVKGLDEDFLVYTGAVRVTVPVTFMVVDGGDQRVTVRARYQTCSDSECFFIEEREVTVTIPEVALVERPGR